MGDTVTGVTGGVGDGVGKLGKGDVVGGVGSTLGGVGKGVGGLASGKSVGRLDSCGVLTGASRIGIWGGVSGSNQQEEGDEEEEEEEISTAFDNLK